MHLMRAYLAYITHFVFLHPFLRRPQVLLTFIRHLTFIKRNLNNQKKKKKRLLFRIKLKQFRTFSASSKFQFVFTLYVHFPL